jgi:hypothetical protein
MDEQLISDDELDALLTERDPLNAARLHTPGLETALARLKQDVSATSGLAPKPFRRSRVRRRLVTLTVAAVVVAVAALAGVRVIGGGSTKSLLPIVQLPAAQAAQLDRIAQATAAGPSAGHGKWLYLKLAITVHRGLEVGHLPRVFCSVTYDVQEWSASAAGPTRVRVIFSDIAFGSARARSLYESHRTIFARALAPLPFGREHTAVVDATIGRGSTFGPTDIGNGSKVALASLPTDPQALVKLLGREQLTGLTKYLAATQRKQRQQSVIDNRALGAWNGLSQILVTSTSARQRAEAYRALTLVRFVRVLGERRDSRGRLGTAVSFHIPGAGAGGTTETLIIDQRTGDLLQDDRGGPVTVWLARAAVASDTDLPGGGTQSALHTNSTRSRPHIFFAIGGLVL